MRTAKLPRWLSSARSSAPWIWAALPAALCASSLGACKWSEFDDLEHETWVGSTEKPDVASSDYGVAIQRGARSGDGGTLVVIGAGQPTYSRLVYSAQGDSSLASGSLELNAQYGIGTLEPQPILLADPTGDDVSLVINSGANSIAVLTGGAQVNLHQVFVTPSTVSAATYMQPPPRTDAAHLGEAQPVQPLVGSGDLVLGTFYANVPTPQPTCKLTEAAAGIDIRALGTVRDGAVDDVLAWGAGGKLYKYPGSVFNGCDTIQPLAPPIDTGFSPGPGSQILALFGSLVVLQGHHDSDDDSFLQVYDVATMTAVGGPVSLPKLRTAAIFTSGATTYVIAGYPTAAVDGKTSAGQVLLFKTAETTGLAAQPAVTLNDAQPESSESFGRAVVAMPFNGAEVVAVAADNEIFVYFQLELADGTMLYEETREGR